MVTLSSMIQRSGKDYPKGDRSSVTVSMEIRFSNQTFLVYNSRSISERVNEIDTLLGREVPRSYRGY